VEEPKGIEFEQVDNWFVILEIDVVGELFESLFQKLILFFFEDVADV
jgi:hypothetical protein